jgi:hypothetical protein
MNRRSQKSVASLASFRVGRTRIYLLPIRSLAYGALSLVVVLAILLAIDRLVLGSLERGGWTAGELWTRHNKLIEQNHRRKTTTNECELRHWTGQPLPKDDPGRRKILVLGDSFVWGPPYATLNHLWWRQLAIELERRGYRNVDVMAVGHPGWSTRRQLECAQHLVSEVKPDLIIWGYVTNDPDEKIVPQIFDAQDQPPYGQRIRRQLQRIVPNLAFKFEMMRAQKLADQYTGPEFGYAYPDWELKLLEGDNFARYQETIQEVGVFVKRMQKPTFLLTLPHFPSREYFGPRYASVLEEWRAAGIAVHNILDEFIARYGNVSAIGPEAIRWGINPADSHPGPKATHFYAETAADYIEAHWPDVLGAKDAAQQHELAINDWLPSDLNVRQLDRESFELDYPATTDSMPRLSLEEPSALIALRFPVPVQKIRLTGTGLSGGHVWISTLDANEHYDELEWRDFGVFRGDSFIASLPAELARRDLAEIRFRANVSGSNRQLRLTLIRTASAEERP